MNPALPLTDIINSGHQMSAKKNPEEDLATFPKNTTGFHVTMAFVSIPPMAIAKDKFVHTPDKSG